MQYYRYFGFQVLRVVEGGWMDIGEMLVWGGIGTKLRANVEDVLTKWTPMLRNS